MIYRFLFVVLILFAAGCVQPVVTETPPAAVSPSPSSTNKPTDEPTLIPTDTATPSPTETATDTATATATDQPSPTREPSFTPTITNTPAPTGTADTIQFNYPLTITVTPWKAKGSTYAMLCLIAYYDFTFAPGVITVYRRDKGGYFDCVAGS